MTANSLSSVWAKRLESSKPGLGDIGKKVLGQQAGVLGEEAEDHAVKEARYAKVFALRDFQFRARLGIG
jgi:hypothetical protein